MPLFFLFMCLFLCVHMGAWSWIQRCLLFSAWPPVISPGSHLYPEVLTLIKNPLWPSMPPRNSCEGRP